MEHARHSLGYSKTPFPEILLSTIQPKAGLENPADCYEFQAILDDRIVADQVCSLIGRREPTRFTYSQDGFEPASTWKARRPVVFRSDSIGIVYSDIIALGRDCVILELRQDVHRSLLKLAPGRKNQKAVNISLYKEEGLIEKLQLLKRIHWDLDRLGPGRYRLVLGKHKSFQFVIQE